MVANQLWLKILLLMAVRLLDICASSTMMPTVLLGHLIRAGLRL
jgi:hypothetical protein